MRFRIREYEVRASQPTFPLVFFLRIMKGRVCSRDILCVLGFAVCRACVCWVTNLFLLEAFVLVRERSLPLVGHSAITGRVCVVFEFWGKGLIFVAPLL